MSQSKILWEGSIDRYRQRLIDRACFDSLSYMMYVFCRNTLPRLCQHFINISGLTVWVFNTNRVCPGSALFGATFNLVTRRGYTCRTPVIFGTLKDGSLQINSLAIVSATETSSKMASTLCQKWFKKTRFLFLFVCLFVCFLSKSSKLFSCSLDHTILFKFSLACGTNIFVRNV